MLKITTNADAFEAFMQKALAGVEAKVGERVKEVVTYIDTKLHTRTPVYTGQAVRNMIWSMGTPNNTVFDAIETPPDTGHTSDMALGSEPRRRANEEAAQATLHALNFNKPFSVFYLSNNSPDIGLIEDGSSGLPGKSRAPAGVFAITMAEVVAKLKSGAPLN